MYGLTTSTMFPRPIFCTAAPYLGVSRKAAATTGRSERRDGPVQAGEPWSTLRVSLQLALHQWWEVHVPVLFAALLIVESALWTVPQLRRWAPSLLSLASFPLIGSLYVLTQPRYRARAADLAWANLYNPLLLRHPGPVLWLDGLALGVAWWTQGWPQGDAGRRWRRHPVEAAMNGATVLGAALVSAAVLRHLLPPGRWEWVDPLTLAAVVHRPSPGYLAALAFNGVLCLVPLLILASRHRLPWAALLWPRFLLAGLFWSLTLLG